MNVAMGVAYVKRRAGQLNSSVKPHNPRQRHAWLLFEGN